jgi:Na+/phosphate symporter
MDITAAVNTPVSAAASGWLTSIIAQSGSVIAILTNSLAGSEIINFNTAFYILLGISLGNSVTPVLASLIIKSDQGWKLRRGFELGLANVIYSIFLVGVILIIQLTTSFFTNTGESVAVWANKLPAFQKIPDLISVITDPVLILIHFNQWPIIISLAVGVAILIFSLGRVGHTMFVFLGGKRHTRAIIEKYMSTHWRAFGIGLALTIIIPSASLLNTLLVPLAIARIIKLRQAVPYIIGTSVGTFIDVLMASFANAQSYAVAGGVVLTLMSAIGILFVFGNFGSTIIYRISRYLSLHVIKMRKTNILKYLAGYILIPLILILIF